MIRVKNYVRVVRGGIVKVVTKSSKENSNKYTEEDLIVKNEIKKKHKKPFLNNKFINRLDKNRDGKVSSSEFKRGEKRFKHLDKNDDGYITSDEAPIGPPLKK